MKDVKKINDLMVKIKGKIRRSEYLILPHAIQRQFERNITLPDIIYVLINGWHEAKKDEFKSNFQEWNYAIRGKTVDDKSLRIAVSFDENNLLIITVIDLSR